MKIRDKLCHQFKETESPYVFTFYKQFQNRVVNDLNASKTSYFIIYFAENKTNIKVLWKGIRSVITIKANTGKTA